MKIKSLLIGMLACTALVGCSDDVIESITPENENPQSALVRGDAYLNFVINTATNSSRSAIDGKTEGDTHESTDDSQHKNAGTDLEREVKEILLVIAKADEKSKENGNNDEIYLYDTSMSDETGNNTNGGTVNTKVRNGYVGKFSGAGLSLPENKDYVSLASPIRLDYTGKYAVLVVVNPAADLDIEDGDDAKIAYEKILSHAGEAYTTDEAGNITSFQMSNKYGCLVDATNHDTPDNPVVAEINVERTVSKTTWRWSEAKDLENIPESLKDKYNVYPIAINLMNYNAVTKSFWYKTEIEKNNETYYAYHWIAALNKATDKDGNVYWVHFNENGQPNFDVKGQVIFSQINAIFKGADTYTEYTGVLDNATNNSKDDTTNKDGNNDGDDKEQTSAGNSNIEKKDDLLPEASNSTNVTNRLTVEFVQGLTFVYEGNGTPGNEHNYYVHLTHYTLTNLSPSVYTVRHIDNNGKVREFGDLGGSEYLCTPFYNYKYYNKGEAVTFKNSMDQVNNYSEQFNEPNRPTTFIPLPGYSDEDETPKTPVSNGTTDAGTTDHDGKDVGAFMQYLYENSCKAVDYKPNVITGLVLAGDIYDNTGAKVPVLYQYNQKYYRTMQRLLDDNSSLKATLTPNSSKDEIVNAGIEVFEDGRCFYYGSGIKHYQYAPEVTTEHYMEYAIMRNNIYSLAVNSITGIGDARLNVTEDTPIEDIRSYVNLKVSILPWIVRFNDLDF